ncbi:MAG: hypothetical protein BEN18_06605 [Epulopiscium sp. Nuni2H_MBin001]|nr:MAG: hypothetical protein BEN18_06605 [Epulopiscium sp. Nuni2H_MBin001]
MQHNKKILLVILVFMVVVGYMTTTSIKLIDNTTAEFVSDLQGEDIISHIEDSLQLLVGMADALATDKAMINALIEIEQFGYITEHRNILLNNIANYAYVMANLSFVDTLLVVNMDGMWFTAEDMFITDVDLLDFPAINPETMRFNAEVTDIYYDPYSNLTMSSIIRFIVNPYTDEFLGVVSLDIMLENLIAEIKESYRIADLEVYIHHNNGTVYSNGDKVIFSQIPNLEIMDLYDNSVHLNYSILDTDINLTLVVDLDSVMSNEYVAQNSLFVIKNIVLLTVGITLVIAVGLIILLLPVRSAIRSLSNIINELGEDYPEYDANISHFAEMANVIENSLPKKIKYLLYYDELTTLPNRKMFKLLYKTYVNHNTSFAIILLDVKNFKGINDACGDLVGNEVLKEISKRLSATIKGDVIRYSGDEFILMVPFSEIEDEDIYKYFAGNILDTFADPLVLPECKPLQIEFNSVAMLVPEQAHNEEDLITKTYVMIRKCKELNHRNVLLFNKHVYETYIYEENIKNSLKTAVAAEEFVVYYQPIVDSNKVVQKAEALIRWFSKDLGFVPPDKFIHVAEQTRVIIDLSNWIIERVAKDISALETPIQVSINISPIQLMEEDFVETIQGIWDKYNLDYSLACLEITEGILLEERGIVRLNIKTLQELGFSFALDDFGTGYSSFSYLKEYSLDIIKIDKAFVDDTSHKSFAIIGGIGCISEALGMQMVLEGIETKEQFESLSKFGLIQGYYISKPLEWKEFIKLL